MFIAQVIRISTVELATILAGGSSEGIGTVIKENYEIDTFVFEVNRIYVDGELHNIAANVFIAGTNNVKIYISYVAVICPVISMGDFASVGVVYPGNIPVGSPIDLQAAITTDDMLDNKLLLPASIEVTSGAIPSGSILNLIEFKGNSYLELTGTVDTEETAVFEVTVTDVNGCTGVHEFTIIIETPLLAPPVADFTANTTNPLEQHYVQFTDASTNSPSIWQWSYRRAADIGFTVFSSNQVPAPLFMDTPGLWTIKLEVTNINGSDVEEKGNYINVIDLPDAATFDYTGPTNIIVDPGAQDYQVAVTGRYPVFQEGQIGKVTVNITHPNVEDLQLRLKNFDTGLILLLAYGGGGVSGANYTVTIFEEGNPFNINTGSAPYTGSWSPTAIGPDGFSTFKNGSVNVNWGLEILNGGSHVGTVDSFRIRFNF